MLYIRLRRGAARKYFTSGVKKRARLQDATFKGILRAEVATRLSEEG
jgi:hypothetical protein